MGVENGLGEEEDEEERGEERMRGVLKRATAFRPREGVMEAIICEAESGEPLADAVGIPEAWAWGNLERAIWGSFDAVSADGSVVAALVAMLLEAEAGSWGKEDEDTDEDKDEDEGEP